MRSNLSSTPSSTDLPPPPNAPQGLYLVGNDAVLPHLQVLCDAIGSATLQGSAAEPLPICIIPFGGACAATQAWIATQPHLSLFQDQTSIQKWEAFYGAVWASQAVIHRLSQRYAAHHGELGYARKFCAFDGPFDRFVVYDAVRGVQQTAAQGVGLDFARVDLSQVLAQLDRHDVALEDWEWLKSDPSATLDLAYAGGALGCLEEQVRDRLHGAQWFGARAGLFSPEVLMHFCETLIDGGEVRWINPLRWWDEAALFNYMTLRAEVRVWNQAKLKLLVNPFMALEASLGTWQSPSLCANATYAERP